MIVKPRKVSQKTELFSQAVNKVYIENVFNIKVQNIQSIIFSNVVDKPILPTPYELQYLILLDSNISSNEDSYDVNNIYIIIYSCTLHSH